MNRKNLLHAISSENVDFVKQILIKDPSLINIKGSHNKTLLMLAINLDSYNISHLLIKHNASLNAKDDYGNTPLLYVSINCKKKILKLLLNNKANINAMNKNNDNILSIACKQFKWLNKDLTKYITILLNHDININQYNHDANTALTNIITHPIKIPFYIINILLNNGANICSYDNHYNNDKYVDLWENIIMRNYCVIQNNMIDFSNNSDIPLLILACYSKNINMVSFLIKHNVNINQRSFDRATPLMIACKMGSYNIFKLLLKNKANVNLIDSYNNDAVSYASLNFHKKTHSMIKILYFLQKKVSFEEIKNNVLLINLYNCNSGTKSLFLYNKGKSYFFIEYNHSYIPDNSYKYEEFEIHLYNKNTVPKKDLSLVYAILDNNNTNFDKHKKDLDMYNMSYLLHLTCYVNHQNYNMLTTLIDMNCDVDSYNYLGYTPIMICILNDNMHDTLILLDNDCDINISL